MIIFKRLVRGFVFLVLLLAIIALVMLSLLGLLSWVGYFVDGHMSKDIFNRISAWVIFLELPFLLYVMGCDFYNDKKSSMIQEEYDKFVEDYGLALARDMVSNYDWTWEQAEAWVFRDEDPDKETMARFRKSQKVAVAKATKVKVKAKKGS